MPVGGSGVRRPPGDEGAASLPPLAPGREHPWSVDESRVPGVVHIPVEVAAEAVVFKIVSRGYDARQVDAHVAALEQELAELRWEHEDLDAQRAALDARLEEQERWTPSFDALGPRVAEIIELAEQEAASLRAAAERDVTAQREQAAAAIAAQQHEHDRRHEKRRQDAERELRVLAYTAESRCTILEADLAQARRDAEHSTASLLVQAQSRAEQVREEAARAAAAEVATARGEVTQLQRQRDELTAELLDLSARLMAIVQVRDSRGQDQRKSG
jgi:hypothetical protein